jgi:hypothetical protein
MKKISNQYPTMKTVKLKLRHTPNLYVDATIDVFSGRPLVEIHSSDNCEDLDFTPVEAERLSRVLAKAAAIARAKVKTR